MIPKPNPKSKIINFTQAPIPGDKIKFLVPCLEFSCRTHSSLYNDSDRKLNAIYSIMIVWQANLARECAKTCGFCSDNTPSPAPQIECMYTYVYLSFGSLCNQAYFAFVENSTCWKLLIEFIPVPLFKRWCSANFS